jgi:hypothetical protein
MVDHQNSLRGSYLNGEYDKPTILVDLKPVKDAENLIDECEAFLSSINNQGANPDTYRFPGLQRMTAWKPKYSGSQMLHHYEKLQPKIQDSEKILRGMLVGIIEKKSALRIQARHLVNRLQACIKCQSELLDKAEKPVKELRNLVNDLANESSNIKLMVTFNNEILRQRNVQAVRQGKSFMPWGKKKSNATVVSEEDLNNDSDYPLLHRRLHELRTVWLLILFYICILALIF